MKKEAKYFLTHNNIYFKYSEINLNISFDIKKRLGENFGLIKIYYSEFIDLAVRMSLNKHLKKLLELVLKIEEDDDDPPSSLMFCLNEADRLRKEINNKYARFLEKKDREIEEKKIEIVEKDIKNKLIAYRINMMSYQRVKPSNYYDDEIVEERHRSR